MTNEFKDTLKEMDMVTRFIREGIQHGTIAEAVYFAMRYIQEGHSIQEALRDASSEWYK